MNTTSSTKSTPSRGFTGNIILRAEAIHKAYPMARTQLRVLHKCDMQVGEGEFVAIMGKSGSGKSTLLHILGALDVPQQGQVLFQGQPIFAPLGQRRLHTSITDVFSDSERRRNHLRRTAFGFIFQFYHLLPDLNVLENVLLQRMIELKTFEWAAKKRAAQQDALELLNRVGLAERLKHKPSELSGGERQRVAIARALVHHPKILFADEPTGNLDAEAGANIMSILSKLHHEGQTIVLVTHDPGIAEFADRTLVLDNGRLQAASQNS